MKTIGDLKKFIDEWADFVSLNDEEFADAFEEEHGLAIVSVEEDD